MAVSVKVTALAIKPLASGACRVLGLAAAEAGIAAVTDFLTRRFSDHSQNLSIALQKSHARAWKTIELSLAGESWWQSVRSRLAAAEERALQQQIVSFLQQTEPDARQRESLRKMALSELKAARKEGLLDYQRIDPNSLALSAANFARFDNPTAVLEADRSDVDSVAADLRRAGYENLAAWILPEHGPPLLAIAVRYFFRRAVEDDAQLFQGLTFAKLDELKADQESAFSGLNDALTHVGQRLEELLGDIQTAVVETRDTVLDIRAEQERLGKQNADIYQAVIALQQKLDLMHTQVRPRDSLSIRSDDERRLVKQLVARYRALPEEQRRSAPALLNAVGQLEIAAGDFRAAQDDFQTVATMVSDTAAKGEAHVNAYRAALEKREFPTAIRELVEAVKLDGKRFAPFPVGKYLPQKILGAGGFGVAFLCKHKYLNAPVVVKALLGEDLDRSMDQVFSEAQALQQLDHPAIIRLQDCGYVDAAKRSRPFIVMDYFDGTTLEDYVLTKGTLSIDELVALVGPVAAGMQAAHARGILHRDIKPANLLVKRLPDQHGMPRWAVKLIDFGLALRPQALKDTTRRQKTLTGATIAGTIDYAAPEQLGRLNDVPVDKRADIYAFGKTCCFALFQTTQPLLKHWKSIPQALAELLERCLAELPEDRPIDFGVVHRCFQRLQGGSSTDTAISTAPIPPSSRMRPTASPTASTRTRAETPLADEIIDQQRRGISPLVWVGLGLLIVVPLVLGGLGYAAWRIVRPAQSNLAVNPTPPVQPTRSVFDTGFMNINRSKPNNGNKNDTKIEARRFKFTFKEVPTPLVATFIQERMNDILTYGNRDPWGKTDGPLGSIVRNTVKYDNAILTMTAGSYAEKDVLAAVRTLDLGVMESDGDNITVTMVAPPAPLREKPAPPARTKLNRAQVNAVLVALQPNGQNQNEVLKLLQSADPNDDNRAQIRSALRNLVSKNNEAIEALAVWGTEEDANFLVSLGEQQAANLGAARPTIDALGKLANPIAAPFLVRQIGNFFVGRNAIEALRSIGTPGEKSVQAGLNDTNESVRRTCCELLKDFGSTDSIKALKFATTDKNLEVVKAAWLAWKTIAYHPIDPPKSIAEPMPKSSAPKQSMTVDDLKVTVLDDAVSNRLLVAIGDGSRSIYTLDPASGSIRRLDWEGKELAFSSGGTGANVLAVSSQGVVVSNASDLKLLDAAKLTPIRSAPFDNARWISACPDQSMAVARSDGYLRLLDLANFSVATTYQDSRLATIGRLEPRMTADGNNVFTRGGGRLYRWKLSGTRMPYPETGPKLGAEGGRIVLSPDGRYVALFYSEGNEPESSFATKVTTGATCVFNVADLKKPAYLIDHGVKAEALALDAQGAWASVAGHSLVRFGIDGKKRKEYPPFAGGAVKQLQLSPDGTRLLLLTETKLIAVRP